MQGPARARPARRARPRLAVAGGTADKAGHERHGAGAVRPQHGGHVWRGEGAGTGAVAARAAAAAAAVRCSGEAREVREREGEEERKD